MALAAGCCFRHLTVHFILPGHATGCHSLPPKQKLHVQSGRTAGGGTGVCAVDRYRARVVTAVQNMLVSGWPGRCCAVLCPGAGLSLGPFGVFIDPTCYFFISGVYDASVRF